LYFSVAFREAILSSEAMVKDVQSLPTSPYSLGTFSISKPMSPAIANGSKLSDKDALIDSLRDLFVNIKTQKKQTGRLSPSKFVQKLKQENEAFRNAVTTND
jgi:hypothetical protein